MSGKRLPPALTLEPKRTAMDDQHSHGKDLKVALLGLAIALAGLLVVVIVSHRMAL